MAGEATKVKRNGQLVQKAGKQLWEIYAKPENGNRKHKTGTDRKALEAWAREVRKQVVEPQPEGATATLGQFIDAQRTNIHAGLKANSIGWYESTIRQLTERFGDTRLMDLKTLEISEWIWSARSDNLKRRRYITVNKILRWAVINGDLRDNPCAQMPVKPAKTKASKDKMIVLMPPEIEQLAKLVDPRYRALIFVLAYTGARISEALGLTVDRIEQDGSGITVLTQNEDDSTKTAASERFIPILLPHIREELLQHVERYSNKYVFTSQRFRAKEQPLSVSGFRTRQWYPALADFGKHMRLHDLRHTCISMWIAQGHDLKRIQTWSGHTMTELTDTYSHLFSKRDLGDAVAKARVFYELYS